MDRSGAGTWSGTYSIFDSWSSLGDTSVPSGEILLCLVLVGESRSATIPSCLAISRISLDSTLLTSSLILECSLLSLLSI